MRRKSFRMRFLSLRLLLPRRRRAYTNQLSPRVITPPLSLFPTLSLTRFPSDYCPIGTKTPEPCPEGTYSPDSELTDSKSCTPCDTGSYCASKGLTAVTADCDAGFYCISGSRRPEPIDYVSGRKCPEGGFCLEGTLSPEGCGDTLYLVIEGARSDASCITCLAGYYCLSDTTSYAPEPTGECNPGYYCTAGSDDINQNEVSCDFGFFEFLLFVGYCWTLCAWWICF